ncbi:UNVERIFIED_CONTAM: hypothetical protein FKN15_010962 [Acipenser sinensis]
MAEDARKLRGWILENAGLEAKSLSIAIQIMWMMDSERWDAYQRKHTPNNLEEGLELVLSYLEAAINETAAQVAGPPAEGECLLSPYPPAEGECLLVVPPQPKWEEPERPQPKWEEPERPMPEWEEPERPTPEWEEPVRPQPKEGGVGASIAQEGEGGACTALGPKLPAEGECLRSQCVHSPKGRSRCVHSPKGRSQCVHSPKRGKSGLAQPWDPSCQQRENACWFHLHQQRKNACCPHVHQQRENACWYHFPHQQKVNACWVPVHQQRMNACW